MSQKFDVDSTTGVLTPNEAGAITIGYSVSGSNATMTSFLPKSYSGALALPLTLGGNNVTSMGNYAFYQVSITSISIPASVTSIGANAFLGMSSLSAIDVDSSNLNYSTVGGILFNKAVSKLIQYPIGNTRTTYTIPEGVTSIGNYAFSEATSLTSITIPYGVTSIGNYAFYNATSLTSISIPASVTSIGINAFNKASSLTSISIPAGVTSIGNHAFYNATSLTSLTFAEGSLLTSIGSGTFYDASSLTSITIPGGVTSIIDYAFYNATSLTSISIPASVTSIVSNAFEGASRLTTVYLPKSNGLGITSPSVETVSFYGLNVAISLRLLSRTELATAVIGNTGLINLLTSMSVDTSDKSSSIKDAASYGNVAYRAIITFPSGDLNALSEEQKVGLINKVKEVYAEEMDVDENKFVVTLSEGSIVVTVDVLKEGITSSTLPICFPAGTPVRTDEGEVSIEKLNPDKDTIGGKRIVAITQSTPLDKYIVCIKKDALGKDVPCADTRISNEHGVCYNGKMVKAKELVGLCENVLFIPYNKEILYNVLLEEHGMMMVNNMECETLHPENIMAKIETGKYETSEKRRIYKELTKIFIENDIVGYVRLCMSQNFKK